MTFEQYFQNTFSGELTNALFLAVIFGLVITDLRKYFPIESFFKRFNLKDRYVKTLLFLPYYVFLITAGLMGVICVVAFFWLISLLF